MPLSYQQRKALKRLKVRLYRTDLRRFSLDRIKKEFSTASGERLVYARLIRCIVYQAATWMQRGKVPKVEGNIRSLFYQWVKPVFSKIPGALSTRFNPYAEMLNALETFIVELKLFKYRDLDIVDTKWENRWYTDGRNPHLLVFAEKDGFVRFLPEVHRKYDVTTVALGGSPSHLSNEYLVEGLRKRLETIDPLVLFSITDYDPSGLFIQRAFAQQLKNKDIPEGGAKAAILPEPKTPVDRCVKAFVDSLLDLITPDERTCRFIVDRRENEALLYLGPAEKITPEQIDWAVPRARASLASPSTGAADYQRSTRHTPAFPAASVHASSTDG